MTVGTFTKAQTLEALLNPQVGDYFSELMHYRMWVVKVTPTSIVYFEAVPPCTIPDDCTILEVEKSYFTDHFTKPHCWVRLIGRGEDVIDWLEGETSMTQSIHKALLQQNSYYCPHCLEKGYIRKLKIDNVGNLVCVLGEHGKIALELVFSWDDVLNISAVLTISKVDPDDLKRVIDLTQKARAITGKESPLLES